MKFLIVLILFVFYFSGHSQAINFSWVNHLGSENYDVSSIEIDKSDNVYVAGQFKDTIDFDPSSNNYSLAPISQDVFFAKYDAQGNLIYAKSFGTSGDESFYDLAVDRQNNLYVCGNYYNTLDFDPSSGVYNLTADVMGSIFIAKYDSLGNIIYAKNIYGGFVFQIQVDYSDNLILLHSQNNIVKLDNMGNLLAQKQLLGAYPTTVEYCSIDTSNNIYVGGACTSTTDFDFSANSYLVDPYQDGNQYFAKYDSSFNLMFAKVIRDNSSGDINTIEVSPTNEILISMNFLYSTYIDVDPSNNVYDVAPLSNNIIKSVILRYNSQGDFLNCHLFTNAYQYGNIRVNDINFSQNNEVNISGFLAGMCDFDLGSGSSLVESYPNANIFFARYDAGFNLLLSEKIASSSDSQHATKVRVDSENNIYVLGTFNDTCKVNPQDSTFYTISNGLTDIFIAKYIISPLALEEEDEANKGIAYPNPIQSEVFISPVEQGEIVYIYNGIGKMVLCCKVKENKTIDVSCLPAGYYIAQTFNKNRSFRVKLIKN